MTSTLRSRSATEGARGRAREAVAPPSVPSRRRWGRIGGGIGAAVIGAWIFAALYLSAGNRIEVLMVADRVDQFDAIERSDLRVARLPEDTEFDAIAASRLDEIVGRIAEVELVAGSPLSERHLLELGARVVGDDEALVGVLIGPAEGPQRSLRRGDPVVVVVRPASGSDGSPRQIDGWLYDSSGEELSSREQPIEVVVPRADAGDVAAAAADRRVSIVALAG